MGPAWSEIPVSPRYGQEDRPSLPAASKHSRMLHTRSRVPNGETAKTGVRHDTTDAHRPLTQSVLPGIDYRSYEICHRLESRRIPKATSTLGFSNQNLRRNHTGYQ